MPVSPKDRANWAVFCLAKSCEFQIQLFPQFAEVPDELALQFEEAVAPIFSGEYEVDGDFLIDLKVIDKMLERISGEANLEFWTIESLCGSVEWMQIREYAAKVCLRHGLDEDVCPPLGWSYIGPKE